MELTILMPCLDEAETVARCVRKARNFLDEQDVDGEVLVADNGSTDGSQQIAVAAGARVLTVAERGYGSALRAGTAAAWGEFVIMEMRTTATISPRSCRTCRSSARVPTS